jgi:hypothetical protein
VGGIFWCKVLAIYARDVTQGLKFNELYQYFPDAIVLGLSDKDTGNSVLNPEPSTIIGPDDNLILMRPSAIPSKDYRPLRKPMDTDLGNESESTLPPS